MKVSTLIAGKKGEDAAVSYLLKKGYTIVERNYRLRNGEIDIIAIDRHTKPDTLVFVEVKTRVGSRFGTPFEAITYFKLKYLTRTALFYSAHHQKLPKNLRIDAVSVQLNHNGEEMRIEHMENISM